MEKLAILGAGNLGISIAQGIIKAGLMKPEQLILTRRNLEKLDSMKASGVVITNNNREAAEAASLIMLCIQPKQTVALVNEIAPSLSEGNHILISTVTGVSTEEINAQL
nr:NAD(P)-binding domain-containing protein [Cyclobacteriaceae bacterium]